MKKWIIPIGIVIVIGVVLMSGYNSLVTVNEEVNGKWSQVENQLQSIHVPILSQILLRR